MKKKIFLLIGVGLLLCGCTAEVNINISDEMISESVTVNAYPDEYYTKEQLLTAFREYIPVDGNVTIIDADDDVAVSGISYYNRTVEDNGTGYDFNYSYDFKITDYSNARTVKRGFKSSTIQVDDVENTILLSTDSGGLIYFNDYPSLESVKINITTDYVVKENNADYVVGNVYTWEFDSSVNKSIYILLDTNISSDSEGEETSENEVEKGNNKEEYDNEIEEFFNEHPFLISIGAILLFLIVVFIVSKVARIQRVR